MSNTRLVSSIVPTVIEMVIPTLIPPRFISIRNALIEFASTN